MSCRLLTILVLASGLALASAASAQTAPGPASPGGGAPPEPRQPSLQGFEALASVGYGTVTELEQLELQPYGPALGLDVGYTWEIGVRLGAELSYGLGRKTSQIDERRGGREVELTSEGESVTAVVSISYDLWLHFLVLRYSLGLGATRVSWKLTNVQGSFAGYVAPEGSNVSFVFAPGLTLLWPFKPFECGLGFDYFFQADAQAPSGIVGQLLVGMKL